MQQHALTFFGFQDVITSYSIHYTKLYEWFIEKAGAYAKDRSVFSRPIGQNQGVQFPIARCYAQMRAAELMVHHAAQVYDHGGNPGEEANMAKLLASEASWAAADRNNFV